MLTKTYRDALAYIYSHTNFEYRAMSKYDSDVLDLDRMKNLLDDLGNPHQTYPSLLIAGTKGKGSTAAIAERILRAAGYKTGLYTSPHLHTLRERICVNGQMVSEQHFSEMVNRLKPHFETHSATVFEMVTTLAFATFAQADVDVAVLEVGLGGRLDATNVVDPAVAVITPISYDHVGLLGDTLTLIAREKAGIIRRGAAVVSALQMPEAMTCIEEICHEREAELTIVGDDPTWRWQTGRVNFNGQAFYLNDQAYWLPLLGTHQITNAVTAMAAVDALAKRVGLSVPQQALAQGVAAVEWPGRLEILGRNPYVIVDSAMNGDSAQNLSQALRDVLPGRDVTLIIGVSADHEYESLLKELLPVAQKIIVTQAHHPRAAAPEMLAQAVAELGYEAVIELTVDSALTTALENIGSRDVVCVTGSLFCVAAARETWMQKNNLPLPSIDPPINMN